MIFDFEPDVFTLNGLFPEVGPLLRIWNPPISGQNIGDLRRYHRDMNLHFARDLPDIAITPGSAVWPPLNIPAPGRTRSMTMTNFGSTGHLAGKISEISENAFRLSEIGDTRITMSRRPPTEMDTWGTIKPEAYTPTKAKPFRGFWIGDFNGHGAECVFFHQPDDEEKVRWPNAALEEMDELASEIDSHLSKDDMTHLDDDELTHSGMTGSLLAIKITGDINVPRSEYTFLVKDLSHKGTLRVADEEPFRGARVVRGVCHFAGEFLTGGKGIVRSR